MVPGLHSLPAALVAGDCFAYRYKPVGATITAANFRADVNVSGSVTSSDIAQTKSHSGAAITAANFRADVNASGSVTSSDIARVKANAGNTLP